MDTTCCNIVIVAYMVQAIKILSDAEWQVAFESQGLVCYLHAKAVGVKKSSIGT
jgi:hypothetical protein